MRFARAVAIALLVLLMAVTPLSALVTPGEFEVRFARDGYAHAWFQPSDFGFTVRLADRTGLARGLSAAPPRRGVYDAVTNYGVDGRMLIVTLEGASCDHLTRLTFERTVGGFLIRERTERFGCFIGMGMSHTLAIHLWSPIDASTVELVADETR